MMAIPVIATAQDTTAAETSTETSAGGLSLGEEVVEVGEIYTRETFDDWELRCSRTTDGNDPCRLYQLMKDVEGNAVAEISIFDLPAGQTAVAGSTVAVPLETLLTEQLTLNVDGGISKRYPFTWCSDQACYARIGLTAGDIVGFKRGSNAAVSIVPVAAPDGRVVLKLSLSGFTKGYEAVIKSNAAITGN